MSITVTLANGETNTYSNAGINYAYVQLKEPAVVAGSRNQTYGTGYQSLTLVLNNKQIVRFVENNPAYRPSGFSEVGSSKTPKEIYDDIVAETEFSQLAPQATTPFDADFPFAITANSNNTTNIATGIEPEAATVSGPTALSVVSFKNSALVRFFDTSTAGAEFTRNGNDVGKTDIFYLSAAEYAFTVTAIEDLC